MNLEAIIGLEVHIKLSTKSKLFSGTSTSVGGEPNTHAGMLDLGVPGTLPTLNDEAIKMAIKFGLAVNAEIARRSIFERKNYFYPDLPKGYQITQFHNPIIKSGHLTILLSDGKTKTINIVSAHLEEDTGKSLHEDYHGMTGIDFNRAGIPLLEVVSAPEMHTATEAVSFLKELHTLVKTLDISDGNLQDGSFRCDANISVRPEGSDVLGTHAEVKNINSFRYVERAINYEIERQSNLYLTTGFVPRETRYYSPEKNQTRSMRIKEAVKDYRYFPEPDLLPLIIDDDLIESIANSLPELPNQKKERFIKNYGLTQQVALFLTSDREMANYFEKVLSFGKTDPKLVANWMMGELAAALNKENTSILQSPISEEQLADLLKRIADETISGKLAKLVFEAMLHGEGNPDSIIAAKGLQQLTDIATIEQVVTRVIFENPDEVAAYKNGRTKLFDFFVGEVMQKSKGKANPQEVNKLLNNKLND